MDLHRALAATARTLLAQSGALQSVDGTEQIDSAQITDALTLHLERLQPCAPAILASAAAQIMKTADEALKRSAPGGDSRLSDAEFDSLEVIVQVLGRPALRLPKGKVQGPATDLGANTRWIILLNDARSRINRAAASVARLNRLRSDGREEHVGTGWRLGADLLVTSRHVAQTLVEDPTLAPGQWVLDGGSPCIADFGVTDDPEGAARFGVASLVYCALEPAIDLAVLRLQPSGQEFPDALEVSFDAARLGRNTDADPQMFKGQPVYVIGHPLLRLPTTQSLQVFGDADGLKRVSPGFTIALQRACLSVDHDCSTLGGSSGSAVLDVYGHCVVGIHLGGHADEPGSATGKFNRAVATALLGSPRFGDILRRGLV